MSYYHHPYHNPYAAPPYPQPTQSSLSCSGCRSVLLYAAGVRHMTRFMLNMAISNVHACRPLQSSARAATKSLQCPRNKPPLLHQTPVVPPPLHAEDAGRCSATPLGLRASSAWHAASSRQLPPPHRPLAPRSPSTSHPTAPSSPKATLPSTPTHPPPHAAAVVVAPLPLGPHRRDAAFARRCSTIHLEPPL